MRETPPGPRRVWNPPNPYLTEHRELLGDPPAAELEVWEDRTRSVLSRNDSPDLDFRWSVNPYRGCFHACAYCYARRTHEYLGLGSGTDFERKLFVKPHAAELLAREISEPRWKGEMVVLSGSTDPYQPLEAAWKLTRGCLEVLADAGNPAGIITKSALVRRDMDVLKRLARCGGVRVFVSIPFRNEEVCRKIEPGTPTIRRRFETVRALSSAGIPVGVAVAPVIPGLNDSDLPGILQEAARCGATSAFHSLLRLPGTVQDVFLHRLREELPLKAGRVERRIREARGGKLNDSRFGSRQRGTGEYWRAIRDVWDLWTRRLGLERPGPGAPAQLPRWPARRPPARATQQRLPL